MQDKRLDIYLDAVTYIALKSRSNDLDRTVSQQVRRLIKQDLVNSLDETEETGRGKGGVSEGGKTVNYMRKNN